VIGFYRASFWAAVVFAFAMALVPQPPQLPGSPSDKVQHIIAFAVLAGLGSAAYPSMSLMKLFVSLSAFGAAIELLQAIPALNRDSDPVDWLVDTITAALVLAVVWWWRNKQTNRSSTGPCRKETLN
jgi:Na+/H+-dicarboxylate symporter